MTALDTFGRTYLTLVLEIDQHLPGYVDAYYGPPDIKAAVTAAAAPPPSALRDKLAWLVDHVPTGDPQRVQTLQATLRAVDCTLRLLAGESFDYLDEVQRLYDITPQPRDEALFTAAHAALDDALPGQGPLAERMEQFRARYYLDKDALLPLVALARDECRRRTAQLVALPPGETIDVRLTSDQPWGAYNWYLGDSRSLIEFNTDLPVSALHLLGTFAHEAYPGHHTEAVLKEQRLYREHGHAEQAAMLLHSPAAVIAEGIATTALEIIFPDDSADAWNAAVLFEAAGIVPESAERVRAIRDAARALGYVTGNAAVLHHTGRLSRAQTVDYLQTYGLRTAASAEKSAEFLSHPLFRSYIFTYTEGYDLIAGAQGDRRALFLRLLTEALLPSQLAAQA